jgi:ADP-heptose:LPS heptosyltransferase
MTLNAKRWPPHNYATVASDLVRLGHRVALVGDQTEATIIGAVKASSDVPLVDLSGRLDFATLAATIGLADAYLGNDSVPLHLAVAMGTPAVALYGPTDPRVYGPYAPPDGAYAGRGIAVVSPQACSQARAFRPGPIEACPQCRCIDAIAPAEVVRRVADLLKVGRNAETSRPPDAHYAR